MDNEITMRVENGERTNTKKVTVSFKIETDSEMIKNADLGETQQTCKVCSASGLFKTWLLTEMQYGTGDKFRYFECPECETLQIEKFPDNIGDYYSGSYYSYAPPEIKPMKPGVKKDTRALLDVGCGNGTYLCSMAEWGFVNLNGCDPFIDHDLIYENGVKIYKKSIHEMDGKYDVIYFNDSLEHMPDPHEVFQTAQRLLKTKEESSSADSPNIVIILPVHPSLNAEIFGMYSFALDSPRHFFLFSEKALSFFAEKYGFYIAERINRPIWGHSAISRAYQQKIPWTSFWPKFENGEIWSDPKEQEEIFTALAECASADDRVDHARFVLKRIDERGVNE